MLKSSLKKFISLFIKKKNITKFPFVFYESELDIYFNINNSIEEFRLKQWGGEKEYVLEMLSDLRNNDILLDIGSSVGLVSILSASKLINGSVISIEPDPENYNCLMNNYKINNLKNFNALQCAIGDKVSKIELFTAGSNGYSPSLKKVNGINHSIIVDVFTVDTLIEEKRIDIPTVIKIDIEGAELLALKGMNKLLSADKKPRAIYLEVHPDFLNSFDTSTEEIFDYLKTFKYRITNKIHRENQILCKLEALS
jgi:FkbM family methyltransferase